MDIYLTIDGDEYTLLEEAWKVTQALPCPTCGAAQGKLCRDGGGKPVVRPMRRQRHRPHLWNCDERKATFLAGPRGILPGELTWELHEAEDAKNPHIERPAERMQERWPDYFKCWSDRRSETEFWNATQFSRATLPRLLAVFSHDEIMRLLFRGIFTSQAADYLMVDRIGGLVMKIKNSMWRWGVYNDSYNDIVRYYNGFKRFDWGMPGFEARIDLVNRYGQRGPGRHHSVYLGDRPRDAAPVLGDNIYFDSTFAFVLYYKGKPALTIGVTPSKYGLLINQVQLVKKKGNRFLYKLPKHYFDLAIERVMEAFSDMPVFLIEGKNAVDAVRRSYGQKGGFDESAAPRMEALYNRDLENFTRGEAVVCSGIQFFRLDPKEETLAA